VSVLKALWADVTCVLPKYDADNVAFVLADQVSGFLEAYDYKESLVQWYHTTGVLVYGQSP